MLADFYIPRLSNDINITVQKNHLGVKFSTEVWTLLKNGVKSVPNFNFSKETKILSNFIPFRRIVQLFESRELKVGEDSSRMFAKRALLLRANLFLKYSLPPLTS